MVLKPFCGFCVRILISAFSALSAGNIKSRLREEFYLIGFRIRSPPYCLPTAFIFLPYPRTLLPLRNSAALREVLKQFLSLLRIIPSILKLICCAGIYVGFKLRNMIFWYSFRYQHNINSTLKYINLL